MEFTFGKLMILIIPIWAAIYTVSFGNWTWKNKNKIGAVAIFVVAVTVIGLPVYLLLFKGQ